MTWVAAHSSSYFFFFFYSSRPRLVLCWGKKEQLAFARTNNEMPRKQAGRQAGQATRHGRGGSAVQRRRQQQRLRRWNVRKWRENLNWLIKYVVAKFVKLLLFLSFFKQICVHFNQNLHFEHLVDKQKG